MSSHPSTSGVLLFGYEASTFTIKIRHCLRLKQIPYAFIPVPSMLPRPLLTKTFGLTYRKIPVLAIGRDIYCDTSLITEALEYFFSESEGYGALYPRATDGRDNKGLVRGWASYWTDRALFRVTTGLIPAAVWRTHFGIDRANLIGHPLDADKLEAKVPENLARLDTQLSILEPQFTDLGEGWIFSTPSPSLADISLFYQLQWGSDIAKGRLIGNLTAGGTSDTAADGADAVFNAQRYPGLWAWYERLERFMERLPDVERKNAEWDGVLKSLQEAPALGRKSLLLPTPRKGHVELDEKCGFGEGAVVSIAPDDTGRSSPTIGKIVALSPEEVVITPVELKDGPPEVAVRIHFPRVGFTIRPYQANREATAKL
ncbi:hypothetical protein B0A48_08456 [Cryoendolithus antarcticus]|uniref:Uncharacterized protein n=1 Tax=Cryoendolithus antarcticus TaxID=1507870 RepID=A0A1V8T5R9_9PEZI|nr:hypothetical protein B0A48_08456 [Cryoendolithus antarcticus]